MRVRLGPQQGLPVADHDLHHHVGELDVHDGGHSLLLGSEEGGTEAHPKVGHSHQISVRLLYDTERKSVTIRSRSGAHTLTND